MAKQTTERTVVRLVADEVRGRVPGLVEIRRDYHLGGPGPRAIADKWDLGSMRVDLQPDLMLVFRDYPGAKPFLAAVEVKVFGNADEACVHDGWGQTLAYTQFGFDGVALWHFFLEESPKSQENRYELFGEQMASAWGAGVWWFAGRFHEEEKQVTTPWGSEISLSDFVAWAYQALRQSPSTQLTKPYVASRRRVLLADLKIPA